MTQDVSRPHPLAGRRILDLGAFCAQRPHALAASMAARLCAGYGAEVIRPLPPGGEPFAQDAPLLPDGHSALDRFLSAGKVVGPATGRFDAAIGDRHALAAHAAGVPVKACLSLHGPEDEDPPISELGIAALAGLLGIVGEAMPAPPSRLAGHQVAYAAGLAACTALLAALHGGGEEEVDISLLDVAAWLNWKVAAGVMVMGRAPTRSAARVTWFTLPCRDGHMALVYQEKDWPPLRDLVGDPRLKDDALFGDNTRRGVNRAAMLQVLGPWFAARSRLEITQAVQALRIPTGPVLWPVELLEDAQFRARDFLRADGMPALPLSWDGARLDFVPQPALATPPARRASGRPLEGLRVVDLGWITAGAATSTLLLDLGADVVKVEGPGAPDPFRNWDGAPAGTDWWNHCPFFNFTNRGKRSLCIDLKDPRGREVLLRLLEGADVLVENFRRGVMASLGLDAAMLRQRFPRLVIASISSQGETGPDRAMVSYGSTLEASSGLAALTGAGDAPVITGRDVNYPDQVVCLFAAGAVVAALEERRRSGRGAHLDLSQRELTAFLLGEELLAAAAGAPSPRRGNHDPAEAAERLESDGQGGWEVVSPRDGGAGRLRVRDGADLAAAADFARGTAVLRCPDGSPAKGIPFRFAHHPLGVEDGCHPLGSDNRAVLRAIGFTEDEMTELERQAVLATRPRHAAA
ncbi:CoA transferase [Sediminicoccus sp. KRV36]|uniref:CoA transferase n=1 Tax=Sediminicoccus sp. KRV36 TaxID=3133721 RepID=UPI00200BBA12|nr:CoA transferase [Sediminicoccus rosea]UPY38919.1 CoA transferase [Sediminicoccus rosea]